MPLTIVLASSDQASREFLAGQLSADGHDVFQAGSTRHALAQLASNPVDVLVLGPLERPPAALELLRALRGEQLAAPVDPRLPVVTLGADDELEALRAYEAGADQHLRAGAGYLLVCAVITAAHRRVIGDHARRHYRVGALHIDTATREVRAGDARIALSAKEYALLRHLAAQPTRVYTKDELLRDVWGFRARGATRTLDSHACRLRRKLGPGFVVNVWGVGYCLTDREP